MLAWGKGSLLNKRDINNGPKTAFIYTSQFVGFDYGPGHPLKNLRLKLTHSLIQAFGLLDLPNTQVVEPTPALKEEMELFHAPEYLQVLIDAERGLRCHEYLSFGLGTADNPIFYGMYTWSALSTGASLKAARMVEKGKVDCAFNIAGGLHHAGPSRASGFCYINDPSVVIKHLALNGHRIAYVDIDAHHGDGVQSAFYDTDQVLTLSIHETGETLFPGTGFVEEMGRGRGKGYSVNIPLYPGSDDEIFLWAFMEIGLPLVQAFKPDIVVTQLGIDAHRTDPLSNLELTIQGYGQLIEALRGLAPKWVALGGGGYNLANVPRAWALAWGVMNGLHLPNQLPSGYQALNRKFGLKGESLFDEVHARANPVKKEAWDYARKQVAKVKSLIFPFHGI